jgi:hypothetical protein
MGYPGVSIAQLSALVAPHDTARWKWIFLTFFTSNIKQTTGVDTTFNSNTQKHSTLFIKL